MSSGGSLRYHYVLRKLSREGDDSCTLFTKKNILWHWCLMVRSFEPVADLPLAQSMHLYPITCILHMAYNYSHHNTPVQICPDGYLIVSVTQHFCLPTSQLDYFSKLVEDRSPDNEGYAFYIYIQIMYVKKDLAYVKDSIATIT